MNYLKNKILRNIADDIEHGYSADMILNKIKSNCYEKEKSGNLPEANAVLADVGERLLPCPFCGHEKTVIISADTVCYVACEKKHCQTEGPTKTTREDAINAWNKRANVS